MRILLINYEYPPVGAGAATATKAIALALKASGHAPSVLTTAYGNLAGTREEEGVRVIRVASRRRRRESATIFEMVSFMIRAAREVRGVVRSQRIEGIIAFFSFPSGPSAWWAFVDSKVPYIISLRGGDVPGAEAGLRVVHWGLTPFRRAILSSALAVVANSPGLKSMSERADPTPVAMIPNGVDTQFFVPPAGPRAASPVPRLLFVGRFQAQKNLPWLIEQLAAIRRMEGLSFRLDLVGDGPLRSKLAERVRSLQLTDIVRFYGWTDRSDLRAHYQAADLVINPSVYEGMPNVVLEAMACGRPVLASRVPGNDTTIVDRVTGWLFPLNDAAGFSNGVRTLLSRPDIALPLGAAARERAERVYSWAHAAESYLELLAAAPPITTHT
jgi:glycosyltransferase involved in cell wall biosynthesis